MYLYAGAMRTFRTILKKFGDYEVSNFALHNRNSFGFDERIAAKTGQPMHAMFFSKPGYLAFSVAACFKLRGFERLLDGELSIDQL